MELVGVVNSHAGLAVDVLIFAGLIATCAGVTWAVLAGVRTTRLDRLLAPTRGAGWLSLMLSGTGIVTGLGALGMMLGMVPESVVPHGWAGSAACGSALASFILIGTAAAHPAPSRRGVDSASQWGPQVVDGPQTQRRAA